MTELNRFIEDQGLTEAVNRMELWQWLKAERQWQDKVRQWLRAEGVSPFVLAERRRGRPEAPRVLNRAYRRRLGLKRIGRVA